MHVPWLRGFDGICQEYTFKQFVSHVASMAQLKEKYSLAFAWKGKNVKWQGIGQIPIALTGLSLCAGCFA